MKMSKLRFTEKWRIYLLFTLVNLISVALLYCAWYFYHQHVQSVQQLKQQLQAVQIRHAELHAEQAVIQHYLPQYQKLITLGFIGKEQPSLWVEQLRQAQQAQQLFPVSYSISARQTAESTQDTDTVQLYPSPMKIELDLLHEGDLLRLLDSLQASHVGAFALRECKINRLSPSGVFEQKLAPNLHTLCTIDWLTISEKTALAGGDAQ
jgi:hypothetical protein